LREPKKVFSFMKTYRNLTGVLTDHELASLGDSYLNFAYSLVLSIKRGEAVGAKVKGNILAEALKKSGLRRYLPSRMSRHMLADAAEAIAVYAWLHNHITLEESIAILEKSSDPVEGFNELLTTIKNRIKSF